MKINCLIIDDEPLAINVIKNYLESIENFEVINTFTNPVEGLNFLKNNKVDVVFLDINMPVLNGINFIKSLENPPLFIITSANSEFALETYELDVLDYLVKPIEFPRLIKALNKASKRLENKSNAPYQESSTENPFIFIKIDKKRMKKIFLNEILVLESLKDYLKISTLSGKYIIYSTLSDFTDLLPERNFLRIHRSYTVAIDKIDAIEGNSIEIEGLKYVIGRSYMDHVKQRILNSSN
ncbi:LytTR family two component transcriptional regulator [Flavobacterium sp. 90]|uniref:LytR/AlgR family response regulator transcription factor n=1 Tax=unclassified Flavobacterium TaxID=196869 RepID=UPI000EB2D963|nr:MULTISPECIES: LytTR family DNA-binding domain-containing protein [unclassified Flavobacterium]RKR12047.1 LytTR family two component transcriptional regulator [Flavobacterium sp. 81]TCK55819.1 LytTR family two component transcriptional regulator [Flavobacterium sp. 90]